MKIFEIESENKIIILLKQFDTNFAKKEALYQTTYNTIIKSGQLSKLPKLKLLVNTCITELNEFINYDWPDKTDPDIVTLINNANTSKNNLEILLNK
jgi:hypothetical protein